MNFNQSIPIGNRPKYAEGTALSSVRDDRNNSLLWKKSRDHSQQQNSYGQAIQKLTREVSKQKRRIVGGYVPTPQVTPLFPFQIYQIANQTDSKLSNFTVQIRDGLVGVRPRNLQPGATDLPFAQGNFEVPCFAVGTDFGTIGQALAYSAGNGTIFDYTQQPTPNSGGNVTLNIDGSATLLVDNSPISVHPSNVQIVIPSSISTGELCASFWIQIVNDPTLGIYTQLWGNCTGDGGFVAENPPFSQQLLPDGFGNIVQSFAVGLVWYSSPGSQPTISNCQVGHLVNRYLELSPWASRPTTGSLSNKFAGIAQVNRGYWTGNKLSGTIFYPGDVVIDDTNPFTLGTIQAFYSYIYTPAFNTPSVSASIDGNFRIYGLIASGGQT